MEDVCVQPTVTKECYFQLKLVEFRRGRRLCSGYSELQVYYFVLPKNWLKFQLKLPSSVVAELYTSAGERCVDVLSVHV